MKPLAEREIGFSSAEDQAREHLAEYKAADLGRQHLDSYVQRHGDEDRDLRAAMEGWDRAIAVVRSLVDTEGPFEHLETANVVGGLLHTFQHERHALELKYASRQRAAVNTIAAAYRAEFDAVMGGREDRRWGGDRDGGAA